MQAPDGSGGADEAAVLTAASAALHRFAEAAGPAGTRAAATDAVAAARTIARIGMSRPFSVALVGEARARAAFLALLAGEELVAPGRRPPAGMLLTVRRGPVTLVRARHKDGTVEEVRAGGAAAGSPARPPPVPPRSDGAAAAAATRLATPTTPTTPALTPTPTPTPALAPTTTPPPPMPPAPERRSEPPAALPWWALWRRLRRWLARRRLRRLALAAAGPPPLAPGDAAPPPSAPHPAAPAPRRAPPPVPPRAARPSLPPDAFAAAVRAFTDADARGATVDRLFVELAHGPLGDDVVVLEVPPGADAHAFERAEVDGALRCGEADDDDARAARAALGSLLALGDDDGGDPDVRPLGERAAAVAGLGATLRGARLRRLVGLATRALDRGAAALDEIVTRAEDDFAARLARLEAMRVADPAAFGAEQLARVRPQIIERVHVLIREATDELGRELDRLAAGWSARIAATTTTAELRAAVAAIDEGSVAELHAAGADAMRLLAGGLAGGLHDLYPALGEAVPRGDDTAVREPPSPAPVHLSLFPEDAALHLGPAATRFRALVRSTEHLRGVALERLAERATHVRQRALAAILDAEPDLLTAVTEPLAAALAADLARHAAWLDVAVPRERVAIAHDRAALAPAVRARDAARADAARLTAAATRAAG